MSIRSRARKVLLWGGLLVLAVGAGGLWFAYSYVTDSATMVAMIRREAPRFLPGSALTIERARVRPLVGDLSLSQVKVWQKVDGLEFLALHLVWLQVRNDLGALMQGRFEPCEVLVASPSLRICRRKDGTWNLQGLLADPWPGPPMTTLPVVQIQKGTIELVEGPSPSAPAAAILRDVALRLEPVAGGLYHFEGTGTGNDSFERIELEGTFDPATGRLHLTQGELSRLELSQTLAERLPAEVRPLYNQVGLAAGYVDVPALQLDYDPVAQPQLTYSASVRLRSGSWACPKLPFPLTEVAVDATVHDGLLEIQQASGINGKTAVRAWGRAALNPADCGPFDLRVDALELELDARLRRRLPPEMIELWDDFRPRGRVSVALHARQEQAGGPVGLGLTATCRDVAILFDAFPYPFERISGTLSLEGDRVSIDVGTTLGGQPATLKGTVFHPGPDAMVDLRVQAGAVPITETLLRAMPPDVRGVVQQFHPTGTIRLTEARILRLPPTPDDPRIDKVEVDALLDLPEDGHCTISWDGLPYPVIDVTGRLELHPDLWIVHDLHGWNSNHLAEIRGQGQVRQVAPNQFDVDLALAAEHMPFDAQLRQALPREWQASWDVLNPRGSSRVLATVRGRAGSEHYHLEIEPDPETQVRLSFVPITRDPTHTARPLELKMDNVSGRFLCDDGAVEMSDVQFQFHDASVRFPKGHVRLQDSGQFDLDVTGLEVTDFRLDGNLRQMMPPVMAQFAQRVDEGKTFAVRTNLSLGWSGRPGTPAWCSWDQGLIIFTGHSIEAGIPLESIQGQVEGLRGRFDGRTFQAHGALNLESISLLGQQVTQLRGVLDVDPRQNQATLSDLRGRLLAGELMGRVSVGLDANPQYAANLSVRGADLQQFTKTLPGRQSLRGLVSAKLSLSGINDDLKTLKGEGEAHITQGDLGELPIMLRLFKFLKLSPATKTAFDSADVAFRIEDGQAYLDPIKLKGDAFSLYGTGTLDVHQRLDMRLQILYGRDERPIPLVSAALREAGGQIFDVHVFGPVAYPKFQLEALHVATNAFRSLGNLRLPRFGRSTPPPPAPPASSLIPVPLPAPAPSPARAPARPGFLPSSRSRSPGG